MKASAMTVPAADTSGSSASRDEIREFHFTREDFQRLRDLIHRFAGISLSAAKEDLVYGRLARRLRARRLTSFAEYIRLLEGGDMQEWEEFVNALTTNLTSFFRESHHFPILEGQLKDHGDRRPFTIWSSASSSGEEPYSIAMTVVQHYGTFDAPVRILGTDIDTSMIEKARQGIYRLEQLEQLSPAQQKRFFLRGEGKHQGLARVRPELQRMVSFRRFNLLEAHWPIRERFDAIFCRNVMIYFDKPTQYEVLKRFVPRLHDQGLFYAGHSESFHHATDLFRLCGRTVYRPLVRGHSDEGKRPHV